MYRYHSSLISSNKKSSDNQFKRASRGCGNVNQHRSIDDKIHSKQSLESTLATDRNGRDATIVTEDDVRSTKYLELGLILSNDMIDKRNQLNRSKVLDDIVQIANCLDLYFRHSANTRISLAYLETWDSSDQIEISEDVRKTLMNFLEYSTRKLHAIPMDAVHLITGGHSKRFSGNELGMSFPSSICKPKAVSVSQEANEYELFVTASVMAHMIGHNLGMEHDELESSSSADPSMVQTGAKDPIKLMSKSNYKDEEEDDQRGSRSLSWGLAEPSDFQSKQQLNTGGDACGLNCLMSKSFTYLQSAISIGHITNSDRLSRTDRENIERAIESADRHDQSDIASDETSDSILIDKDPNRPIELTYQYQSLPFQFSQKSIDSYHNFLRMGYGICLFNKPNQIKDSKLCGNGIVDKGEDCDCGTQQQCNESNDSCCDPKLCLFKPNTECTSGDCCEKCKLKPKGHICRKSLGECDPAEYCDGKSPKCSADVYMADGHPCSTGYCYQAKCPTPNSQCSEIWGQRASQSDMQCYRAFNVKSNSPQANCSQGECDPNNEKCGILYCQGGDQRPVIAELTGYRRQVIVQYECKWIVGQAIAYVRDGSKCGEGKVCLNQSCLPINKAYSESTRLCPRDEAGRWCSGRGWCSSAHRCQCDPGFSGNDCSQLLIQTSKEPFPLASEPPTTQKSTTWIPISEQKPATDKTELAQLQTQEPASTTTVNSANMISDKKKNDALGARYLVLILVTIVAAVYIGFALMANCYRRKNFYKPDKVLRHHQMSCKLESLRSSIIERRIADAKTIAGSSIDGNIFTSTAPLLANDEAIDFHSGVTGPYPAANQYIPDSAPCVSGRDSGGSLLGVTNLFDIGANQQAQSNQMDKQHKRVPASVHYVNGDERPRIFDSGGVPMQPEVMHSGQRYRLVPVDKTLVQNTISNSRRPTQLSSFNPEPNQTMQTNLDSGICNSIKRPVIQQQPMNRAISLSNFNNTRNKVHQIYFMDHARAQQRSQTDLGWPELRGQVFGYADEDDRDNLYGFKKSGDKDLDLFGSSKGQSRKNVRSNVIHTALATPIRSVNAGRVGNHNARPTTIRASRDNIMDDCCSAPSSPEVGRNQRHQAWVRENPNQSPLAGYHETAILNSMPRFHTNKQQQRNVDVGEPAISVSEDTFRRLKVGSRQASLDVVGRADDFDDDSDQLSNLPPPPPPLPADSSKLGNDIAEHDRNVSRQNSGFEPSKSVHSTRVTTYRQVPLNDCGDQSSLISQLQQLERVQNLHKKQQQLNPDDSRSVHEFFSLPLIVQLSALLARNLRANPEDSPTRMPIDDFLNTLNNTSVAHSSRKSFQRNASTSSQTSSSRHTQQESNSRNATLKRQSQQVKLHNLQALITRLQQLQEQTAREQRGSIAYDGDDDNDEDEQDYTEGDEEQPRNGRSDGRKSRSRSMSRSSNRAANRSFHDDQATAAERVKLRTNKLTNHRLAGSQKQAESVYSMSDSEDGSSYMARRVANRIKVSRPLAGDTDTQGHSDNELTIREAHQANKMGQTPEGSSDCDSASHGARLEPSKLDDFSEANHSAEKPTLPNALKNSIQTRSNSSQSSVDPVPN